MQFDQSNYAITYNLPLPALCVHVAINMYVRINVFFVRKFVCVFWLALVCIHLVNFFT